MSHEAQERGRKVHEHDLSITQLKERIGRLEFIDIENRKLLYRTGWWLSVVNVPAFVFNLFYDDLAKFFQWRYQPDWNTAQWLVLIVTFAFALTGIIFMTYYEDVWKDEEEHKKPKKLQEETQKCE